MQWGSPVARGRAGQHSQLADTTRSKTSCAASQAANLKRPLLEASVFAFITSQITECLFSLLAQLPRVFVLFFLVVRLDFGLRLFPSSSVLFSRWDGSQESPFRRTIPWYFCSTRGFYEAECAESWALLPLLIHRLGRKLKTVRPRQKRFHRPSLIATCHVTRRRLSKTCARLLPCMTAFVCRGGKF